ncbi:hypothetical protein P7H41_13050 [Vagococcus fluvialis]|nr:hypothetical protein [Vagococcus fluvialis]
MKLVIPLPLIDLNKYINAERSNRFAAAKVKKNCTNICKLHSLKAKNQGLDIPTPFKATFEWYVKDKRKDLDNIAFQKKFILDGMIEAGLIKNDGYNQHRHSEDIYLIDKNERVEITFEALEED